MSTTLRPTTLRLLGRFSARRAMLLDHCPRGHAAEAIRTLARLRSDIARSERGRRALTRTPVLPQALCT